MRLITLLFVVTSYFYANAQITFTSAGSGATGATPSAYDSTYNFDVNKLDALKGQVLLFIPYSTSYASAPKNLDGFFTIPEAGKKHHEKSGEGGKTAVKVLSHVPLAGGSISSAHNNAQQHAANHNTDQDKEKNVYKPVKVSVNGASYYQTPTAEVTGKYYKIVDFVDSVNEDHHHGFMVKLASKDNPADVFFYKLTDTKNELAGTSYKPNFVVVGYFEKQKQLCLNKNFYVKKIEYGIKDVAVIGTTINLKTEGEQWQCYDVTMLSDNKNSLMVPAALLKNSNGSRIAGYIVNTITSGYVGGEVIAVNLYATFNTEAEHNKIVRDKLAKEREQAAKDAKYQQELISKYGQENASLILNGKVKIGMTKEMCIASWGEPEKINTTTIGNIMDEQWVYDIGKYLYMKNGVLTAIQDFK